MDALDKLVPALIAAQLDFPVIGFDATNPHYRNRYATLAHMLAETRPHLAKHGLAVTQLVTFEAENALLVTVLMHTSGQRLESRIPILSEKPGPQAFGSGITYARRYAYAAILGIAAEDDDDGESAERPTRPARADKPAAAKRDEPPPTAEPHKISEAQARKMWATAAERAKAFEGVNRIDVAKEVLAALGVEHTADLTVGAFDNCLRLIEEWEPGKYERPKQEAF